MAETNADDGAPATILALGAEGDGVAAGLDGSIYVPQALPGEQFRRASDGAWVLAGPPSPERRAPPLCPHFPACGGCTAQHMGDAVYRRWKSELLSRELARAGIAATPEPMLAAPLASRRRAALSGRHTADGFVVGFHAARSADIVPMTACAVLAPVIVRAVPLLARIGAMAAPQPAGEARLSVLAAREGLDVALSSGSTRGRHRIDGRIAAGLARTAAAGPIMRLTWNGDPVLERARPTVLLAGVAVTPPPAAFLQASAEAEAAMAAIVAAALPAKARQVADLFAGLGTFAFAMATRARVEAFESDRRLVDAMTAAARHASGLKPVVGTGRDLVRDPLSPKELERFDAVVLDPPRAGAKAQAEALAASSVPTVVAVSCNPATLARDLSILLAGGFRLERLVPVDQFHFTPHLEAVAVLRRER